MIPEAPFFFVLGSLSLALAGLAGLVAALRRGETMTAIDLFRLREMLEFAFANRLLAVSTVPLVAAVTAALTGRIALLEATLVVFLARPMVAFLFVLESFEERQTA